MFGLGITELLLLWALPIGGIAGIAVLYLVIRAAVRDGNKPK